MFGDIMNKLQEAQNLMQNTKENLEKIEFWEEIEQGTIKLKMNANKKVLDIQIAPNLLTEKQDLEDLLVTVLNKAMQKADEISKKELEKISAGIMPNLNNLLG